MPLWDLEDDLDLSDDTLLGPVTNPSTPPQWKDSPKVSAIEWQNLLPNPVPASTSSYDFLLPNTMRRGSFEDEYRYPLVTGISVLVDGAVDMNISYELTADGTSVLSG